DDLRGGAAGVEHGGEDFLSHGSGNFPGFDQGNELSERSGSDGACSNFLTRIVQAAQQFGLHPVGGGFSGSAGSHHSFKVGSEGLRVGKNFGVVGSDAKGRDEAGALGKGKFGNRGEDFVAPGGADVYGEQVRLREIAVVVG